MRTELYETTLVDILIVAKGLPQDEIDQIEAFSGADFDTQDLALQLMSTSGPKWTIRIKESLEPIVVAGLTYIGPNIWRTWFLATAQAWDEYGKEITKLTIKTRLNILKSKKHMRIETICLAKRKKAQEWYKMVGMEYESTLRCYGVDGESAVLYVSLKGAAEG